MYKCHMTTFTMELVAVRLTEHLAGKLCKCLETLSTDAMPQLVENCQ